MKNIKNGNFITCIVVDESAKRDYNLEKIRKAKMLERTLVCQGYKSDLGVAISGQDTN